jgi:hypothetical protein
LFTESTNVAQSLAPPALNETEEGVKSAVFVEPDTGKGQWVEFRKNDTRDTPDNWHPALVEGKTPSGLLLRVFARGVVQRLYESSLHEHDPQLKGRFVNPEQGVWRIAPHEQERRDVMAAVQDELRAIRGEQAETRAELRDLKAKAAPKPPQAAADGKKPAKAAAPRNGVAPPEASVTA